MSTIREYLINEKNTSEVVADEIIAKLEEQPDIEAELEQWIETRAYPTEEPVSVEGYTAEAIAELAPFLDGVGAYMFLITLRTDRERGLEIIDAGFPRK